MFYLGITLLIIFKMYVPTSSQVSAPSKDPIVTSNKNSDAVIKWFNTIKRKPNATFITFDVVNFYPSITEQLLLKALDFAKKFTNITA